MSAYDHYQQAMPAQEVEFAPLGHGFIFSVQAFDHYQQPLPLTEIEMGQSIIGEFGNNPHQQPIINSYPGRMWGR